MRVSHETIYLSLFVQSRGVLRRELCKQLRSGRHLRRPPQQRFKHQGQGQIPNKVMISERPAKVADDVRSPGHWEGDLLLGKLPTGIATLVERQTRYCQLVALPDGHGAEAVRDALIRSIGSLPEQLRRSLTWDQGKEMREHAQFTIDSGIQIYFCDPRSPWPSRIEREHQRAAAPVLAQAHRPQPLLPRRARRCCGGTQRQTATNARLDDTPPSGSPRSSHRHDPDRSARRPPVTRPTPVQAGKRRNLQDPSSSPPSPRAAEGLQRADPPSGPRRKRLKRPSPLRPRPSGLGLRDDGRSSVSLQAGVKSQPALPDTPWPTPQPAWEVHSL